MAIIFSYPLITSASNEDRLIITDVDSKDGNPTRNIKISSLRELISPTTNYSIYTGTLTQAGANPPNITLIKNTTGKTMVWTRTGVGTYVVTASDDIFIQNKIIVLANTGRTPATIGVAWERLSDTQIEITTRNGLVAADDAFITGSLEIKIYS
jgi:hypothetical protein